MAYWANKAVTRPDLMKIFAYSDDGQQTLPTHNGNPELEKKFRAVCEKIPYMQIRLKACSDNVDLCIYKEQWLCRQVSSMQHFCELLYTYGPPGSGKDVDALFTQEFFGKSLTGTIATTDVVKLQGQSERGVDGSTPTMNALNKMRVALVAEVPQAEFAWHRLKHYVEQMGIRAHSRGHSAAPNAQQPTFALLLWSNYAPDFGNPPPEGAGRRTAVIRLDARYGQVQSEEDGEYLCDNQLKYRIMAGEFRLQQLWTSLVWLPALRGYETMIPKPEHVVVNCADVLPSPLKAWAMGLKECRPSESMTTTQLKELAAGIVHMGVRSPQLVVSLRAAGFTLDVPTPGGRTRGVKFKFSPDKAPVFVRHGQ